VNRAPHGREKSSKVGGSTIGSETMAAAASLNHAFECASHQASGVATTSSASVEMVASSIVSLIGVQISDENLARRAHLRA
jgi:hypothetical protein